MKDTNITISKGIINGILKQAIDFKNTDSYRGPKLTFSNAK
jgi:hypothetical protein